jgi:hypothetical protein
MNKLHTLLPSSLLLGKEPANQILKLLDTCKKGSLHGPLLVSILPAPYQFSRVENITADKLRDKDQF